MNYLTSIRGIAAVIVILYHIKSDLLQHQFTASLSFLYAKGYLAVDFFLILSGFILCWKYSEPFSQQLSSKELYSFIVKRFSRIFPLHAFVMCCFCVIPLFIALSGRQLPLDNFSAEQFFVKLIMIDLWTMNEYFWQSWNTPSWSISGELFAYLIFPVIAYTVHHLNMKIKLLWYVFLLVLIALMYEVTGSRSLGDNISSLGLLRCLVGFCLGTCVYYFYNAISKAKKDYSKLAKNICIFLTFLFGILAFNIVENHFYVPVCFSLFLLLILLFKSPFHQFLEKPTFVFVGEISYSIYLSHTLVLYVLTMVFLGNNEVAGYGFILSYLLLTLLVSSITYKTVEIPARLWLTKKLLIKPT